MTQKEKIIENLTKKDELTQGDLSQLIYGDRKHLQNLYASLMTLVKKGIVKRVGSQPSYYSLEDKLQEEKKFCFQKSKIDNVVVPTPSKTEVDYWLNQWNSLQDYSIQEEAINDLFKGQYKTNKDLKSILIKCSVLNDFYSTNIFKVYPVACHIKELDIDERLSQGDMDLVNEIATITISGVNKYFYSFATKYCSHHNQEAFPIYDSYVDTVLRYFRDIDQFCAFEDSELKNYSSFKKILLNFRIFYDLKDYSLKDLDKYLWQLGKKYFPKNYQTRKKRFKSI